MEKLPTRHLKTEALRRLVERTRQDAFFVGRPLAIYQKLHGLDDHQLAQWLECSKDNLTRLALCRLPDDKKDGYQQNVRKIAVFAPCNPDRLVQLLREVASWEALQEDSQELAGGFLLAARDRKPDGNDDLSGPSGDQG
jgi:hypothetical protein